MIFGGSKYGVGDDLLEVFVFHCALLQLKMLAMPVLTSVQRQTKKVFANAEDAQAAGGKVGVDQDVERVRRAHLNDMEGIYLFFANAALYLTTKPDLWLATNLFRVFTATRFIHTFVYVKEVRQPARGITWMIGFAIQAYMVFRVLKHCF